MSLNFGQTKISDENSKEFSQNTQEEIAYFKTGSLPTMKELTEATANVRQFVWKHWQDKKDGTVTRESVNKHGEKSIVVYQIKCLKKENCQVFVEIERENVGRGGMKVEKTVENLNFVATSLNRIESPKEYYSKGIVKTIPEEKQVKGNLYLILLKDENGKVVSEL